MNRLRHLFNVYGAVLAAVPKFYTAYRAWVWMEFVVQLLAMVVLYFFWQAVYASGGTLGGLTFQQTINYVMIAQLLMPLIDNNLIFNFGWMIRDGQVAVMLAPIDNSSNWDVLVAIRDNTRQRQAQEALRTNEEKLRTLFELLPVGVSFIGKDGRVNELNSALAEILDLPRCDILAGNYRARRFIRADGSPKLPSEFASTRARLERKTIYNVETGIVKDDGEIIWTSVNAAPVQVADVEAAIVTIDITERKKAEEALHRNRERLRILSRRLVEVQEEERHAIARELHDRVGQNLAALTLNLNILRNQLSGEVNRRLALTGL